jgi:HEAT repeat protein
MKQTYFIAAACLIIMSGCTTQQQDNKPLTVSVAPVKVETLKAPALKIVEDSFNDANPFMRNHAIEAAISTDQKQLISNIIQRLSDDSLAVRFTSAVAIGDMDCRTCKDLLNTTLRDTDENVCIAAAYSLIKLGDQSHYQRIRDAAVSTNGTLRANALLLIGKLGNPEDAILLHQALRDLDAQDKVHLQAVDSLAMMKDVKMYKTKLWPLLISKYADDRVMGIRGMGSLATKESIEAIESTLKNDDILEVRLIAAEELGKLGNTKGQDEVIRYFQTNPNLNESTMATGTAVTAIGRIKCNILTGYLAKSLESQSPYIRLVAAQSVLLMAP